MATTTPRVVASRSADACGRRETRRVVPVVRRACRAGLSITKTRATVNRWLHEFEQGLDPAERPKQSRTQQLLAGTQLAEFARARVVTKRVGFGELFRFAEFPPTDGLTHDAESFRSRRFRFSACGVRGCDGWPRCESFLPPGVVRHRTNLPRDFAPNSLALGFNDPFWVNDLVGFGPRMERRENDLPKAASWVETRSAPQHTAWRASELPSRPRQIGTSILQIAKRTQGTKDLAVQTVTANLGRPVDFEAVA
jgi:hypothetical protein